MVFSAHYMQWDNLTWLVNTYELNALGSGARETRSGCATIGSTAVVERSKEDAIFSWHGKERIESAWPSESSNLREISYSIRHHLLVDEMIGLWIVQEVVGQITVDVTENWTVTVDCGTVVPAKIWRVLAHVILDLNFNVPVPVHVKTLLQQQQYEEQQQQLHFKLQTSSILISISNK